MNLRPFALLAALLLVTPTHAAEDAARAAALQLIEVTETAAAMEQMQNQMKAMLNQSMQQLQIPPEGEEIAQRYMAEMGKLISDEMQWSKIEEDVISIYTRVFTADELNQLTEFYRTPLGQKLLEKMPEVMQASVAMSQRQMQRVIPQIEQLSRQMADEIRAKQATAPK